MNFSPDDDQRALVAVIERLLRESYIPRIAPVSPQMIMNFIAKKALGLPKSY